MPDRMNEIKPWKVLSSTIVIDRPWLKARRDKIMIPSTGVVHPEYYVLEYPAWVNTIAIDRNGRFVMVQQYRHGLGEVLTELCAGVVENGETPLEAAQRELAEETGYGGGQWRQWMVISANPGSQNNLTYCFLATGVELIGQQHLDTTEDIAVKLLEPEDVRAMLSGDRIRQSLMAAPLWKLFALEPPCR